MSLVTKVKAGAINNLSDARYFAVFAEWVGFCFDDRQSHCISPTSARELIEWLVGPRIVAECGLLPIETINKLVNHLSIDAVQADYDLDRTAFHPIVSLFIRRILIEPHTTAAEVMSILEKYPTASNTQICFLLDFQTLALTDSTLISNIEEKKSLYLYINIFKSLQKWCNQHSIILSLYRYTPDAILPLLNYLKPLGIEFLGETEQVTGLKSFDSLNDIIDILEA